jgi:hypothetical protein
MGRTPGAEPRKYQIEQLWEVHHEILRRLVIGQKSVEIARDLDVTAAVVSYVKNSEVGKRQLSLLRSSSDLETVNVAGKIKELAARAVQVMEASLAEEQPMQTRMKGAVDILDRAGYGAPKILRTENVHAHLTMDDIEEIKARARLEGVIVDVVAEVYED